MVQRSLVEPALTVRDVVAMPVGLLQFLLREVNAISGISASEEQVARAIEDPLAQAAFRLSQAFGWTPEQIGKLTMGEVLAHLQLLKSRVTARRTASDETSLDSTDAGASLTRRSCASSGAWPALPRRTRCACCRSIRSTQLASLERTGRRLSSTLAPFERLRHADGGAAGRASPRCRRGCGCNHSPAPA